MAEAPSAAEVHRPGGMRRVDRDQASSITVTSRPSVVVVIGLTGPLWLERNDHESDLSGIGHTGTGGGRRAERLTVVTASDGLTVRCRRAATSRSSSAGAPLVFPVVGGHLRLWPC